MNVESKFWTPRRGFFLMCLLICLAIVVAFCWRSYTSFGLGVSKDQQLIAIFYAHRPVFEKLQQMATEDVKHGWYFNSPYFEGYNLSESRQQEYRDLISEIKPSPHVGTSYDSSMAFIFAGGGSFLAIGPGWSKGIAYVPSSYETNGSVYGKCEIDGIVYRPQWHGILLTNLDNAPDLEADIYLRPIESNWFLIYGREDD